MSVFVHGSSKIQIRPWPYEADALPLPYLDSPKHMILNRCPGDSIWASARQMHLV